MRSYLNSDPLYRNGGAGGEESAHVGAGEGREWMDGRGRDNRGREDDRWPPAEHKADSHATCKLFFLAGGGLRFPQHVEFIPLNICPKW